jgi:hypothetical protein
MKLHAGNVVHARKRPYLNEPGLCFYWPCCCYGEYKLTHTTDNTLLPHSISLALLLIRIQQNGNEL